MGTYKTLMRMAVLILSIVFLGACTETTTLPQIESISIDQETLQTYYEVGAFDITDLELLVLMSDGTELIILVNENMISEADLAKLSEPGQHNISITYQGQEVSFNVHILSAQVFNTFYKIYQMVVLTQITDDLYTTWVETLSGFNILDDRDIIIKLDGDLIYWQYLGDEDFLLLFDLSTLDDYINTDDSNIKSVEINQSGMLIITYADDTTENLGQLIETFEVSFYTDLGTLISKQTVLYGQSAITPLTPVKEGHTFVAWSHAFNDVTEDLTVTAIFEPSIYTVTLNPYNGQPLVNISGVTHGATLTLPTPSYINHTFVGWFTDPFGLSEPFTNTTPVTSSITLYAYWVEDVPKINHFYMIVTEATETTFTVEVYLGGDVLLNGYDLRLNFDSDILSYHTHVNGVNNVINTSAEGVISLNYSYVLAALNEETLILTITFNILAFEETTLSITIIEAIYVNPSYEVFIVETHTSNLLIDLGDNDA